MKLLSALDALFLHLETPEQPMHVGGLNTLSLPKDYRGDFYEDLRRHWVGRLHLAPIFHRKLATMPLGLTNPAWVMEEQLDLDWHLQRVQLPKPGTMRQLNAFVAKAHAELLPRDRPMWRAWVIEGLADGQKAFYAKFHHAALDGQGGVALAKAILDLEPNPAQRPAAPEAPAGRRKGKAGHDENHPSTTELLAASFRGLLGQYSALLRAAPQMTSSLGSLLSNRLKGDSPGAGTLETLREAFSGKLVASVKGLVGPKTRLNVAISNKRAFATLSLPLNDVKLLGRAAGGSLNDAVLAIISGGLRRYLQAHDELPRKPLICAMPVSLRSEPHKSASEIENQSSMVLTTLATDVADPVKRFAAIIEGTQKAKQLSGAMKTGMPTDLPSLGIPWLMTGLTKLYTGSRLANKVPPLANVTVSNVPGPPVPLYLAGAKLTAYYPVSIVVHGIALNITLESYNGHLDFGLIACARAMPDVSILATFLEESFEELKVHWPVAQAPAAPPAKAARAAVKPAAAAARPAARKARAKPADTGGKPPARKAAPRKGPAKPEVTTADAQKAKAPRASKTRSKRRAEPA